MSSESNTAVALENLHYLRGRRDEVVSEELTIQITGEVNKPGMYHIRGGLNLLQYLEDAGIGGTGHSVIIVRTFGADKRSLIYSLEEPESLPRPKAGDLIIVNHNKNTGRAMRQAPPTFGVVPNVLESAPTRRIIGRKVNTLTDVPSALEAPLLEAPTAENIDTISEPKLVDTAPATIANKLPAEVRSTILPSNTSSALVSYATKPHTKRLLNLLAERQAATGAKSFAIMSPLPGDGRTFFCSTMALSYALLLDSKVLILDCSSPAKKGDLTNGLPELAESERVARGLERASITVLHAQALRRTAKDDIDFVLRNFIADQCEQYDLILLDTAPVSDNDAVIDPIIAAGQADGALVVLREQSQEHPLLLKVSETLKQHSVTVVGIVTNALPYNR